MATINKFGREIDLEVLNAGKGVIFNSNGLRVDFKVLQVGGFNRAEFKVYNLSKEMIRILTNGERYVNLRTRLHGGAWESIASNMFVSNAYNEVIQPNSITSLYCFNAVRKTFLEKQVSGDLVAPNLKEILNKLNQLTGAGIKFILKNFPEETLKLRPPRRDIHILEGSVDKILDKLALEYNFKFYTGDDNDIILMFMSNVYNLEQTSLGVEEADTQLLVENMRSNPVIGPSKISITSILDGTLKPTSTVDVSKLITARSELGLDALASAQSILKQSVSGFTKYQIITVEHEGSNFTPKWETRAMGTAPTQGTRMGVNDNFNWYG